MNDRNITLSQSERAIMHVVYPTLTKMRQKHEINMSNERPMQTCKLDCLGACVRLIQIFG